MCWGTARTPRASTQERVTLLKPGNDGFKAVVLDHGVLPPVSRVRTNAVQGEQIEEGRRPGIERPNEVVVLGLQGRGPLGCAGLSQVLRLEHDPRTGRCALVIGDEAVDWAAPRSLFTLSTENLSVQPASFMSRESSASHHRGSRNVHTLNCRVSVYRGIPSSARDFQAPGSRYTRIAPSNRMSPTSEPLIASLLARPKGAKRAVFTHREVLALLVRATHVSIAH